jgi:hypothetical protein
LNVNFSLEPSYPMRPYLHREKKVYIDHILIKRTKWTELEENNKKNVPMPYFILTFFNSFQMEGTVPWWLKTCLVRCKADLCFADIGLENITIEESRLQLPLELYNFRGSSRTVDIILCPSDNSTKKLSSTKWKRAIDRHPTIHEDGPIPPTELRFSNQDSCVAGWQ